MKAIAALALTTALACHSVPAVKEPPVLHFRVLHSGSNARYQGSIRNMTYVPMAEAYQNVWKQMIGETPAPEVDFSREAVVFIIAGQRPTGGYKVDVKSVAREGDTLVVDAPVTAPSPDMMVTQAFTSPFAVVAVDKTDVSRVRWKNEADSMEMPRTQ